MSQLGQSLSDRQLGSSSLMPVVGSSVVIKVLRRSCQNILTVTDLIIDGWLLGFADWPRLTVLCNAPRMADPVPLTSSALALPPLGSSQTTLSGSQACSMLMQCDHFQPSHLSVMSRAYIFSTISVRRLHSLRCSAPVTLAPPTLLGTKGH